MRVKLRLKQSKVYWRTISRRVQTNSRGVEVENYAPSRLTAHQHLTGTAEARECAHINTFTLTSAITFRGAPHPFARACKRWFARPAVGSKYGCGVAGWYCGCEGTLTRNRVFYITCHVEVGNTVAMLESLKRTIVITLSWFILSLVFYQSADTFW